MRHRMITGTGLGNPSPILLDNSGKVKPVVEEMINDAIKIFFLEGYEIDYHITDDEVTFGIEPAYQHEKLKIISVNRKKDWSFLQNGKAWGGYGSNIVSKLKHYGEYQKRGKFVKFVDQWHEKVFRS